MVGSGLHQVRAEIDASGRYTPCLVEFSVNTAYLAFAVIYKWRDIDLVHSILSSVRRELILIPNPMNIPICLQKYPLVEELPDSPTVFANFLTFVVDKIFLLRNQSATKPLATVMIHETKKGIPDNRPFYNTTAGARTLGNVKRKYVANVIS